MKKGLPSGKPFNRDQNLSFCDFFDHGQFIVWKINTPDFTIVVEFQYMITLTMDTPIIVDGEFVLLIYPFVV